MPKKKKITTVEEELPEEKEQEIPQEPQQDIGDTSYEELMSTLAELGEQEHRVVVYRYNKEKRKFARLDEWGHKEFSLSTLADSYGGGTYRIFVYASNGQFVTSKIVEIDEAKKPKEQVVLSSGHNGQQDIARIYELLLTQSERNNTLILGLAKEIISSITNLTGNKNNNGLLRSIDDILNFKQLFLNNEKDEKKEDPFLTVDKVLGILSKGMEIGASMVEPEKENSLIEGIVKKALDMTPTDKLASALFDIGKETKQITLENKSKEAENKQGAEHMTNTFSKMAKLNISPEKIAKTFLDSTDEFTFNLITNLKDNLEDLKKIIYEFDAGLKSFPEWTNKFIDEIIRLHNEMITESEKVISENKSN